MNLGVKIMYKVEIKELVESKVSLCKIIPHIDYKDLYNLVKPYTNEVHLSFSLPNNCPNGKEWGNIYASQQVIGQIKMTYIEEEHDSSSN